MIKKYDCIQTIKSVQNKSMKTIVFTGGGTAGHIMPNVALFPEAEKVFDKIVYIGSNKMEKEILKKFPTIDFYEIPCVKLIRKLTPKNLLIPFKLIQSVSQTKKILKKINPSVIFSKGGYVSLPVVIASKQLNIPVISHESDITMGLANKIIYRYSNLMLTSFETTAKGKKNCQFVGSPIRESIFHGNKNNLKLNLNEKPTILIFGGSLGSKKINDIVEKSIDQLCKDFFVIHLTGKGKKTNIENKNYYQQEFASNIEDFFDASDIVVSRGGANALFELLALKKPTLIIPLSKSESRGDQIDNANYFAQKGFAKVLLEEELSPSSFISSIKNLYQNKQQLIKNMASAENSFPNKKIVDIILKNSK